MIRASGGGGEKAIVDFGPVGGRGEKAIIDFAKSDTNLIPSRGIAIICCKSAH